MDANNTRMPPSERAVQEAATRGMPIDSVERWIFGTCLRCKKPILIDHKETRGCHSRCYQELRRAIFAGKFTEDDLIQKGLIAPQDTTGRPSKLDIEEVRENGRQYEITTVSGEVHYVDYDSEKYLANTIRDGDAKQAKYSKSKPAATGRKKKSG